jgi:hypothetical protein
MHDGHVGYVLMLDPYAQGADRVTQWGTPPTDFPTDWDEILSA